MNLSHLYESLPLPPNQKCIRLLQIHAPNPHTSNEIISSSMVVVDLSTSPSFTALSYVWGQKPSSSSSTKSPSISCLGYDIPLTAQSYSALFHLRKKFGAFTIWIDAVCINQIDAQEKARQIPLMGEIYSRARMAFVWLGEGDEGTSRAMWYLGSAGFLEFVMEKGNSHGPVMESPRIWAALWSVLTAFCSLRRNPFPFLVRETPRIYKIPYLQRMREKHEAVHTSYYDLNELLTREWTRRIWTYQEIILSRNPVVVCGDDHLPWARFSLSVLFLDHIKAQRLANMTGPNNTILRTWKKVILTRIRLIDHDLKKQASTGLDNEHRAVPDGHLSLAEIRKYQRFLYDIFSRCLRMLRIMTGVAYVSVVNLIAAIAVSARLDLESRRNPSLKPGIFAYLAISIVLCLTTFSWYATMTHSYYHRTYYAMPFYNYWVRSIQEDEIDDFIDAIISRRSTDPKDMAFGLHAVLSKKIGKELPAPDYHLSVGRIYKDLTYNILDATNHLRFLIPAAVNHLPGQASWVPDWASNFPNYWLQPFVTNRALVSQLPSKGTNTDPFLWRLHPQEPDKLTIWAHKYCIITKFFEFKETQPYYKYSERAAHISNITIMLGIFTNDTVIATDFFTNRLNYPEGQYDANPAIMKTFWRFIWSSKLLGPERTLDLLLSNGSMIFPFPYGFSLPLYMTASRKELLDTYFFICSTFSKSQRRIFVAKPVVRRGLNEIMGVCTFDAQAGDQAVYIPGIPSLLLLRSGDEASSLVSPAVAFSYVEKDVQDAAKDGKKESVAEILEPFDLV